MINVDISPITGLSPIFFFEQKRTLILFSISIQGDDCRYLSWNHLNVSDDIDLSCNTTKTFPEMISIDSTWQTSILFSVHHNHPGSDNFPLSWKEFYQKWKSKLTTYLGWTSKVMWWKGRFHISTTIPSVVCWGKRASCKYEYLMVDRNVLPSASCKSSRHNHSSSGDILTIQRWFTKI